MPRKKEIEEKLRAINAKTGDVIRIIRNTEQHEGVLMPRHEFSQEDIITIKLKTGYNIGIAVDEKTQITLVQKQKIIEKPVQKIPFDPKKPTISIIGTGGTIACYIDYRTGAVHPASSAEELAFSVPEIFNICNVKSQVAYQMLSENIEITHWQSLATLVAEELNNGVAGVVIPHGTDTLGYTAAALSFFLKNLSGPVVLVGAQRSSDRPSSDAAQNLIAAATVAGTSNLGEVVVVMHGETSDTYSTIHRGVKVRKFHTSRRDAFQTVNDVPLGTVKEGKLRLRPSYTKKTTGPVIVDTAMNKDVGVVYFYPGLKPEDIPQKKGLILAGTGLGHVSEKLLPRITSLINNGSVIVMTSQCLFGRVNMHVYSVGRDLIKAGVISGEDMLLETAYIKLMWALAHTNTRQEVESLMKTNLAGEISERTTADAFISQGDKTK
ncbi:MAG: glutamyl-tRNA(Gln) amidotransferase subunit D [Thermoplasmata archaeon M11B2D]|nr:MAG: glutamyl-tRNA(Gln) amidotransferase subunit D [Thermoplasmata archaeon M11B2D]PNX53902.1 MAG: glutamyl-tRNA(Gln) amidotransferase subunit D [Thermoplasmata archaeon M9B2D]